MSIATDLTRLQTAKADLKTAIEGKGVTVPSATKIDGYADLVDAIQTGGGGTDYLEQLATNTLVSYENDNITSLPVQYAFAYCNNLKTIKLPNLTSIQAHVFENSGITAIVFPKVDNFLGWQPFMNMSKLIVADILGASTFQSQCFNGDALLETLIIRRNSVPNLSNINAFNSTPFASGKAGGTLYVPSALISSYQSATNWSTILGYANNSIAAIEGSQYENYYADGTPIPTT